jgi:hypothetical protein
MTDPSTAHPVRSRVRHLRLLLAVSAAVAVLGAVIGLVTGGPVAALFFGLGVIGVAASYTVSTLAIAWADSVNPQLVFGVGVGMYVTKFSLVGVVLIRVGESDWAGRIPFATGIVIAVVAWSAAQIWWTVRTAHPYVTAKAE